jgi:hypothetical protein
MFTGPLLMSHHGPDQPGQTATNTKCVRGFVVRQNMGNPMHPAERDTNRGPELRGHQQGLIEVLLQLLQGSREPLFEATLARLSATFVKRSWSFSPEASSGGRPSSVIALRTALQ